MSRSWKLITVWLLIATALFVAVQAMQHRAERSRFSFDAANGRIELKLAKIATTGIFSVAMRIPAWVNEAIHINVNDKPFEERG